jgi:nicotinate phosphoribosyltransferase
MSLLTDLYQLTMAQAYFEEEMDETAVFSLFVRKLPMERNFVLATGVEPAIDAALGLSFLRDDVAALERLGLFSARFLRWLRDVSFTGSIRAVPEGTPLFGGEPLLEVSAPLAQAQLLETIILNRVHYPTVASSKAARIVAAARGRRVVDFALRRAPGEDAALALVRSAAIAGVDGTSNVLASLRLGIPAVGTMAHSFVQAHDSELAAFGAFASLYPEAVLVVDTYDSLEGVRHVIGLARRWGADFRVRGVRLDSGDLDSLARAARRLLDDAGLARVQIFASGGLDEYEIERLVRGGAPIDGFGVGTRLGVSEDAPSLDLVYKLVSYAGVDRTKRSPGKRLLPGPKQVWRFGDHDLIARANEQSGGRPLLEEVVRNGRRTRPAPELPEIRARAASELAALPERLRALEPFSYPVELSQTLDAWR